MNKFPAMICCLRIVSLFCVFLIWTPVAAKAADNELWVESNTGMEFVRVEGGCFRMGDVFGDGRPAERPVHKVCVKDFYIGKYEVTLGQWLDLVEDNSWNFRKGDNFPVELVSWQEVRGYIKKLNDLGSHKFRLPSEAEWEYAARSGGREEKFAGGEEVEKFAWFGNHSGGNTRPVGSKEPNGLGLYDMSGNVSEWVQDWYDDNYYQNSPAKNPRGPGAGSYRVIRGGGGIAREYRVRTMFRDWLSPETRLKYLGMRLVVEPDARNPREVELDRIWKKRGR